MAANILITGAAGYIGGSLVADFLASDSPLLKNATIHAAVRSEEQAAALSKLGINVIQLDLKDEEAVINSVVQHEINIVIQTASSLDPSFSLPLITALGKNKERTGKDTYYIHTSGLGGFIPNTGWPEGEHKDTDNIFEIEKQLAENFPIRKTDVTVTEYAKTVGVTSFIVVPSLVYGKGTGEWNQLSVAIPLYIKASISEGVVHKFAEDAKIAGVHISDLTALFGIIVEKIIQNQAPPSGEQGYYFGIAHDVYWWEYLDHLAKNLLTRGLAKDPEVRVWPSEEVAAETLGVPAIFSKLLWNSSVHITATNETRLGWKPKWDKKRSLDRIGEEVDIVLELGRAKSSLVDSLFNSAKN